MWEKIATLFAPRMSYEKFLVHLSESPATWEVINLSLLRSKDGDCPIVEVCRRLTGKHYHSTVGGALAAGWELGLRFSTKNQIIRAADRVCLNEKRGRIRTALLLATIQKIRQQEEAEAGGETDTDAEFAELAGVS